MWERWRDTGGEGRERAPSAPRIRRCWPSSAAPAPSASPSSTVRSSAHTSSVVKRLARTLQVVTILMAVVSRAFRRSVWPWTAGTSIMPFLMASVAPPTCAAFSFSSRLPGTGDTTSSNREIAFLHRPARGELARGAMRARGDKRARLQTLQYLESYASCAAAAAAAHWREGWSCHQRMRAPSPPAFAR